MAGVQQRMQAVGAAMIRRHLPAQHREFFGLLPTLLVGALDDEGQPWATVLRGEPGFVHSPDDQQLRVQALPTAGDPLDGRLRLGQPIGLLGLQPHTRRRNRANGHVVQLDDQGFALQVDESFGNCPKHIHPRWPVPVEQAGGAARTLGPALDDEALALIARSDTLFIASAAGPDGPLDLSHRGGDAGFVEVLDSGAACTLQLPDFPGNRLFNTLGNLLLHPVAGLLFIDHDAGHLLHLAVRAQVRGPQQPARLQVIGGRWRPSALDLRWTDTMPAGFPEDTA